MHQYFWFGNVFKDFLFKDYNIASTGGLIATCLGLASLALLLEGLKVYRSFISLSKIHKTNVETSIQTPNQNSCLLRFKEITIRTSWYTLQDVIGYIVMLSVMTFNGYFTVAVILGSACGYFLFGHTLMDIKLSSKSMCNKQQLCSICVAKMERSHLLSTSSILNYDSSNSETNNSLMEVAEGLASVMNNSNEEHVSVEVHSQEQCT